VATLEAPMSECIPWVRLEREPEEWSACMSGFRKLGQITTAKDVWTILHDRLDREDQEVGIVLLLDTSLNVRGAAEVSRGERDSTVVPIPDILRLAILDGATAVVFLHNHPTGLSAPSDDDKTSTLALASACEQVGIMLMDHVIMGRGEFFSFADSGLLTGAMVLPDEAPQPAPAPAPAPGETIVEDRASGARRGWEHRREKDEWVVQNLDPSMVPLWRRIGAQFRGTPGQRYEAFMQYVHDHPNDEMSAIQSNADEWLEEELKRRGWAAESFVVSETIGGDGNDAQRRQALGPRPAPSEISFDPRCFV